MKLRFLKLFLLTVLFCGFANMVDAQKKSSRKSTKRTTKSRSKSNVKPATPTVDTTAVVQAPVVVVEPEIDSLPIKTVRKSLRPDEAVETSTLRDRTPLPYEHLRADDAVYRHRIWREIDAREKINLPFMYAADENNGNQSFISILFKAIQDSAVTVFSTIDDRFTTPMTKSEVAKAVLGEKIPVINYDSLGNPLPPVYKFRELNLDSFYKFHVKEEVIFDKESSRLFWRILGIAPVVNVITSQGVFLGPKELFWVYYPDMRPVFSKYEIYNGKNYGARMSWEELFESRMFSGRIIKSTMDNPKDIQIRAMSGMDTNGILQLFEGENIKEKIFNYEQDLWSY